jgi:hypothetical protein
VPRASLRARPSVCGTGRRPDTELNAQSSTDLVPEAADDALPTPVEQALSAEEALAVAEAEAVAAKAAGVIEAVPAPLRTQEEIITAVLTFAVPALISTLIGPILSMIDTGAPPPFQLPPTRSHPHTNTRGFRGLPRVETPEGVRRIRFRSHRCGG